MFNSIFGFLKGSKNRTVDSGSPHVKVNNSPYKIRIMPPPMKPDPKIIFRINESGYMEIDVLGGGMDDVSEDQKKLMYDYNKIRRFRYLGMLGQEDKVYCRHKIGEFYLYNHNGFCVRCGEMKR